MSREKKEAPPITPEEQKSWWNGLNEEERFKWGPLINVMSPEERITYHRERRTIRDAFVNSEDSMWRRGEEDAAERVFYKKWKEILTSKLKP